MSDGVKGLVDQASWAPASGRRRIEPADIDFARAKRPGWGWQTIAKIRGVNALDLQHAVEAAEQVAAPKIRPPKPPPTFVLPPPPPLTSVLRPGGKKAQVLQAIAAGAKTQQELADQVCGITRGTAGYYAMRLRQLGLVGYASEDGWPVTREGYAEIAALNALEAERADG